MNCVYKFNYVQYMICVAVDPIPIVRPTNMSYYPGGAATHTALDVASSQCYYVV